MPDAVPTEVADDEESHNEKAVILGFVSLVLLCSFLGIRLVQKYKLRFLPESGVTIIVGFVIGLLVHALGVDEERVRFQEQTFTMYILPLIIFDAGFSLQHAGILQNLGLILTLAVFGTIIAALFIGGVVHAMSASVYSELNDQPVWEALCFGAMLAAIDPVAVISVLGKKFAGKPNRLYYLIFAESVLNDAVSIVLYKVFLKFLKDGRPVTAESFFAAVGTFLYMVFASLVVGWVIAAASALTLKHVNFSSFPAAEIILVVMFGLSSYYAAEALSLSGIMALFISGRTMGHYTWHNLSSEAKVIVPSLLHALAIVAETYVFAFLGLAFWTFDLEWRLDFSVVVLVTLVLSRAVSVFPLVGLWNCFVKKSERLPCKHQIFMWFTGLRGAIAFGLALSSEAESSVKNSKQFVTTTLIVVAVTVFCFGGPSDALLSKLGLDGPDDESPAAGTPPVAGPSAGRARAAGSALLHGCLQRFFALERERIAPLLRCAKRSSDAPGLAGIAENVERKFAIVHRRQDGSREPTPVGEHAAAAGPPAVAAPLPAEEVVPGVDMEEIQVCGGTDI